MLLYHNSKTPPFLMQDPSVKQMRQSHNFKTPLFLMPDQSVKQMLLSQNFKMPLFLTHDQSVKPMLLFQSSTDASVPGVMRSSTSISFQPTPLLSHIEIFNRACLNYIKFYINQYHWLMF